MSKKLSAAASLCAFAMVLFVITARVGAHAEGSHGNGAMVETIAPFAILEILR